MVDVVIVAFIGYGADVLAVDDAEAQAQAEQEAVLVADAEAEAEAALQT